MSKIYIDTSILGAYYCPEPLSDKVEDMLLNIEEPMISNLTEVEFASLIAKKRRIKDLTEAKARKAMLLFRSHLEQGYFKSLVIMTPHYLKARDLIADFHSGLRTLDALHLSVVLERQLRLFTADRLFAAAARKHGADVVAV